MSWRDVRDSCTCSCTLTGLPAQIPTELRRGSANKTQTVILEVPTCLTPHILTIPLKKKKKKKIHHPQPYKKKIYLYKSLPPFTPAFHCYIILLLLQITIATLHYYYVACFPRLGGHSRSNNFIIITQQLRTYIYVFFIIYFVWLLRARACLHACTCGHAHARITLKCMYI